MIRKNLLRRNQRDSLSVGQCSQKVSKTAGATADFSSRVFPASSCRSQFISQPKTVKHPVSRCKAVCGTPVAWVASIYLREIETRCRGVFRPLLRRTVLPLEISKQRRRNPGRLGNRPTSQWHFLPWTTPGFTSPGFGKMPRARAAQRVRKKSRIKSGRHK